jgi:hypothetical protein
MASAPGYGDTERGARARSPCTEISTRRRHIQSHIQIWRRRRLKITPQVLRVGSSSAALPSAREGRAGSTRPARPGPGWWGERAVRGERRGGSGPGARAATQGLRAFQVGPPGPPGPGPRAERAHCTEPGVGGPGAPLPRAPGAPGGGASRRRLRNMAHGTGSGRFAAILSNAGASSAWARGLQALLARAFYPSTFYLSINLSRSRVQALLARAWSALGRPGLTAAGRPWSLTAADGTHRVMHVDT